MAPKRKRGPILEVARDPTPLPLSLLDQIRNMEEFASLGQYLFMFGIGALKLPDFGREVSLSSFTCPDPDISCPGFDESNHVYSRGLIIGAGDRAVGTAVGVGRADTIGTY